MLKFSVNYQRDDHTPGKVRIAHSGDLHLGAGASWAGTSATGINQREQDLYDLLQGLVDHLIETGVDIWCIPGDAFDSINPNTHAEDALYEAVTRARAAGIIVIVVGGNHDVPNSTEVSPLVHLAKYFDALLFLEQGYVDVGDDLRVHCLPYFDIARHCDGRAPLQDFELAEDRINVLAAHAYAYGPNLNARPESVVVPPELVEGDDFKLVMLGHVHQHVKLSPTGHAFFSGALDRLTFGEMDTKPAYWLHHIEQGELVGSDSIALSTLGIPNQPRPFFEIRVAQGERTVDETSRVVLNRLEQQTNMQGAIARIVISECDELMMSSVLPTVWEKRFRKLGGLHVKTTRNSIASEHALDVELADAPTSLDEGLRAFLLAADRPQYVDLAMEVLSDVRA